MKELIDRFLDKYVGDGATAKPEVKHIYNPYTFTMEPRVYAYNLCSDNGTLILVFCISDDGEMFTIYRSDRLCSTVGSFFDISSDESMRYIRNWFADKYDIKKIGDLMKFIPTPYFSTPAL